MIGETFSDKYGTIVTVRCPDRHNYVQLLMTFADGSEQFSYGFTVDDFAAFAANCARVSQAVTDRESGSHGTV